MNQVPVIDVHDLVTNGASAGGIAGAIGAACRDSGFFYVVGHGVDEHLQARLERVSRQFFALGPEAKLRIRMAHAGRAWRGYFPVGGELTSGRPDWKEGLYFGAELPADHPTVRAQTPMHGPNLFPAEIPEMRDTVLDYMAAMTRLGHSLMRGLSCSLGLEPSYFDDHYTRDPLVLFRIFHYPPLPEGQTPGGPLYGVGEHTDYGVLTMLKQDDSGGLDVKVRGEWVPAPPIPGSLVCNIGDMLDRMTAGRYRSTPHRVRNLSGRGRLSFPFFFDPSFFAEVHPLPSAATDAPDDAHERWDHSSPHQFRGTYGDYLLGKVAKVFPQLRQEVIRG